MQRKVKRIVVEGEEIDQEHIEQRRRLLIQDTRQKITEGNKAKTIAKHSRNAVLYGTTNKKRNTVKPRRFKPGEGLEWYGEEEIGVEQVKNIKALVDTKRTKQLEAVQSAARKQRRLLLQATEENKRLIAENQILREGLIAAEAQYRALVENPRVVYFVE